MLYSAQQVKCVSHELYYATVNMEYLPIEVLCLICVYSRVRCQST